MKIRELLKDEKSWIQRHSATDAQGIVCSPFNAEAACFCLSGAGYHCYGSEWMQTEARRKLVRACDNDHIGWNDDPSRTHAEVLELVERLDV